MDSRNVTALRSRRQRGAKRAPEDLSYEIRGYVAELLAVNLELVEPGVSLLALGAQSFDFVQLVFKLERVYGVEIPRSYTVPDEYTVDTYVQVVANARRRKTLDT